MGTEYGYYGYGTGTGTKKISNPEYGNDTETE